MDNYFDLHCDTPYICHKQKLSFDCENLGVFAGGGRIFNNWNQVFAVWIPDGQPDPFGFYRSVIKDFKQKLQDCPANLTPFFSVEGGSLLENDLDRLYTLKEDGIMLLTLTWNGENRIAGGCMSEGGLTGFGRQVISRMNSLKMACDLSHINQKSFYPAIETAEYPVATHSNCRSVFDHPRNLKDDQLKLIAQKRGVIGLCFYPGFLGGDVFEMLYRNVFHMLDLGLEDSVALGSDFDGADMDERLNSISRVPALYEFLYKKGISLEILNKIFFTNAARVFKNL